MADVHAGQRRREPQDERKVEAEQIQQRHEIQDRREQRQQAAPHQGAPS
jgi:hypothetical protein